MPASTVFTGLLIHSATIKRNAANISGTTKAIVDGYATLTSGVPCRLAPIKIDSMQSVGGVVFDADYKVRIGAGTDVQETDKLTISGDDYLVQGIAPFADGVGAHHILLYVKKQQLT